MEIGLCSGSVFKDFGVDMNQFLDFCKSCDIKNIEFTYRTFAELENFWLSENSREYLARCRIRSLHFPFKELASRENLGQVRIVERYYHELGMNNITIHPNMIKDLEVLDVQGCNYSIESVKPSKQFDSDKMDILFAKCPNLGFILDTTHAFLYSSYKPLALLKMHMARVAFIHFSDLNHMPFSKSVEPRLGVLQELLVISTERDIPVLLEVEECCCEEVKRDLSFIRHFFNHY